MMTLSLLDNYGLEEIYVNVSSVKKYLYVHDKLIKKFMPDVYRSLESQGLESILYATSWYMTLFTVNLPFAFVLRLMDIFLLEKWKIVYRIALALLKVRSKKILASSGFEQGYTAVKEFGNLEEEIDEDTFFKIVCE